MTLATLMRKGGLREVATATVATMATEGTGKAQTVAKVASVAVANSTNPATIDREAFEARAAIREIDGGFNRQDSERLELADLADDRIHCADCANLRGRVCAQAAMLGASHGYTPVLNIARRCEGFKPRPEALAWISTEGNSPKNFLHRASNLGGASGEHSEG